VTGADGQAAAPSRLHVRVPGVDFHAMAAFELFCRDNAALLADRAAREHALAAAASAELVREGSCALCLCATRFTTPAATPPEPPNWREGERCGCADGLGNRERAMLHHLEAMAGLGPWSRVLGFGPPAALDRRLGAGGVALVRLGRLRAAGRGFRLDVADASCHAAVSSDHLQRVPPLRAALAEIRRALVPGGSFVFTVPFHPGRAHTVSPPVAADSPAELDHAVHEIGWDVLEMLREAGFVRSLAHLVWSEELGHLGPFNLLFSATA
jgi:hypothetical protein